MPSRLVMVGQAVGVVLWSGAVAAAFLLVVYATVPPGWPSAAAQVVAYGLIVVPALLVRPRLPLPLGAGRRTIAVGVALLSASIVVAAFVSHDSAAAGTAAAIRALSAGIGEEVVFRGVVFERLRAAGLTVVAQVLLNAFLFAAFHVPLVLLQGDPPTQLVLVLLFGLAFSMLRVVGRGLLLPVAAHVAVDLAG